MLKFGIIIGLSVCLVAGIPSPLEIDYEEGEDACLTSKDSKAPETECIFPFTYNNFTYTGCPTDPVDQTKRWCSTKTDKNGVHIVGNSTWGYCTSGCKPEVFLDELLIGTDANNDTQNETCDYTACNGFTYKLDVFDKVETYGQCQFPAGKGNAMDDYFCFVNKDSACTDKVPYGDEEEGLFLTTLACKDPNAPVPRIFGFLGAIVGGFVGAAAVVSAVSSSRRRSSYTPSYGTGRYFTGGYRTPTYKTYTYSPRKRYSSRYNYESNYGPSRYYSRG